MQRICFLIIPLFYISCKQPSIAKEKMSFKDSVVIDYLNQIDSSEFYDTTTYDYKVLKAYMTNNIGFFKEMVRIKKISEAEENKYPPLDTCVHLKKISELNADEVYRFSHSQSFCYYNQIITINRIRDSVWLHYIEYSHPNDDGRIIEYRDKNGIRQAGPGCKIEKQFYRQLTKKDWTVLEEKIEEAGYWGLKPQLFDSFTDGSHWQIAAYTKIPRYPENQQIHSVWRHCTCNTAFDQLGRYFLKLSGEKTMCGDFF